MAIYGFTIGALSNGCKALLNGRDPTTWNNTLAEYARKAVLELCENYKFPGLQTSGPVVSLVALQAVYAPNFFLTTGDQNLEINKVDSFFIYTNGYTSLTANTQQNTGFNLRFSTINDIEILINIPGLPTKWTRHEDQIYFGCVPDQAYQIYMRYQKEHPFPNAGGVNANNDVIQLPNSWQDIVEYDVAMRAARDLNLQSKASELYNTLHGDSQFQISGGISGSPGLIFKRTSQEHRDQTTTTKSMRLRIGMQR